MKSIADTLRGGDRRSIGKSDSVVAAIERHPEYFTDLWNCLSHSDGLVRMRAADALEKLSRTHAAWFAPHRKALLSWKLDDGTAELRWHLVLLAARLTLSLREAESLLRRLEVFVHEDASRIVKVMALQAAVEIGTRHPALRNDVDRLRGWAFECPWPSVRARARKLCKPLAGRA
ncbi:MAG: hypothetical protein KGJ79_09785 [Alphaproteobacteria bacterium]|nr:hypothetical protein [Alphaproteobacteria bacterium]MDE2111421.1 hypothetical protein [Alphaproteobacteria bacterium]MDE2493796.1 hypothetical protein [Alphaproteobacteria bacterium]